MFRAISRNRKQISRLFLPPKKLNIRRLLHYNQSKYKHLLNRLTESKIDIATQRDLLGVFVRVIEDEHHFIAPYIRDQSINVILDLETHMPEHNCPEIEELCRLALALLGYARPLKTDYLRVLSIDGGGIRGILVMELMKRLEEITKKRIFDLFDFVCGVSTGSILVCGLAADKNRTLSDGIKRYKDVSWKVFHQLSTLDRMQAASRLMWTHAYYDVDLWEQLLQEHMTSTKIIDTAKFSHVPKFCCVSTTVSDAAIEAHVFRNYVLPFNVESIYNGSHNAALWEVVRCSSAAPTFFGDFILDGKVHQDGGILYNNPSCVAIHEAKLLWPNQKICLVSLGTGRSPNKRKTDSQKLYTQSQVSKLFNDDPIQTSSWKRKFSRILEAATDTEQTHHICSDLMAPGTYFRFNPYLTETVSMTECRPEKIKQIEKDALLYFRRNEDKFEELVEILLKPRSSITRLNDYLQRKLIA